MPLIDQMTALCQRLAPLGWSALFNRVGLNIAAPNLTAELTRNLPNIKQAHVPGFADFHGGGTRAIEPGEPARSLFYHALASPAVHPTADGSPALDPNVYPTQAELDTVENYIYSLAARRVTDFPTAVVAVFATQYRTAARTSHALFADTEYSRTGVARVGTQAARYDQIRRSYWPLPPAPGTAIVAMGARYSAYLAVPRKLGPGDSIFGGTVDVMDANRTYLIPVHKLFSGTECLVGLNLTVQFAENHRNEKLRRIHTQGGIPPLAGFDLNAAPFVRDSNNAAGDLLTLQTAGAGSALVLPTPHPAMVRTATQRRSTTNRDEIVRFRVPAATASGDNRFGSSYDIQPPGQGRLAPEYVNIRHRVQTTAAGAQTVEDINGLDAAEFANLIDNGGFEAAHFIDDTCDGCISATIGGLPVQLGSAANVRSAYSLITAPDFFPLMDQVVIFDWATNLPGGRRTQFSQGSPEPLARGRTAANPTITRPGTSQPAFNRTDLSMTAVLATGSRNAPGTPTQRAAPQPDSSVSFLPDAASNVFQPGWDISLGQDQTGVFHTAYGLGSPFPEDAKLCAALNSFWPAAAPDATRTFGLTGSPTAQPLLDGELGRHPSHPRVLSGAATSSRGWDGEFGPFLETVGGQLVVNFAAIDRSDYVSNTLAGRVQLTPLVNVTAEEMIRRMEALRACVRTLPPTGDQVSTTGLFLASAEQVADWAADGERGSIRLIGPGYKYTFVTLNGAELAVPGDVHRARTLIGNKFNCQLAMKDRKVVGLAVQTNGGAFTFKTNP
jgi:hypothetical protein